MGSQALFDRIVTLAVIQTAQSYDSSGNPVLTPKPTTKTVFVSKFQDGSTGFRISAKVKKIICQTAANPNHVSMSIYNVGPQSRAILSQPGNLVFLSAGYGQSPQQIFQGEIIWGKTEKRGPDYVTEIEAQDGFFASQNSRVDISFQKGLTFNSAINTVAGMLQGSNIGIGQVSGVPEGAYNQPVVFSGKTVEVLKQLCEKHDLSFTIQDGNVLILPYGSDRGAPAPVIGPDTGLIGIPEIRSAGLQKAVNPGSPPATPPTLISFKSLLNSNIGLQQKVVLVSKFVNGVYTTLNVNHDIDSFEGPFFTEVECA